MPPAVLKPNADATTHPSGDNRFKMLDATMKRHQYQPDALIEVLHTAQELFGYLETDLLLLRRPQPEAAAQPGLRRRHLLPLLHLSAAGRAHLRGLHGHGLLRQGRRTLLAAVEHAAGVKAGETTADRRLSLLTARCLGACGIAPAVVFDGTVGRPSDSRGRCWSA